jgi:predicted O-methyltransferase YrrM
MEQQQFDAVDEYIAGMLVGTDAALEAALHASTAAGLPEIQVAPNQGKLLTMLARMVGGGSGGARRILEIGTLGGYSTICLARGLAPGGDLITLELDPKCAAVATENIARAGLAHAVHVRVGPAIKALPGLAEDRQHGAHPFDLIFIDADKVSTPEYFEWSLKLSRPGTLIVVDNVVRDGGIVDAKSEDPSVKGMRRFFELLKAHQHAGRVTATALQMVGVKGWDGMAIVTVSTSV